MSKITRPKIDWRRGSSIIECLLSKCECLSSEPESHKKKKKKKVLVGLRFSTLYQLKVRDSM
jgi:hypothetical protein